MQITKEKPIFFPDPHYCTNVFATVHIMNYKLA